MQDKKAIVYCELCLMSNTGQSSEYQHVDTNIHNKARLKRFNLRTRTKLAVGLKGIHVMLYSGKKFV